MWKLAGKIMVGLVAVVLIALATWEGATAERYAAPPAHKYDVEIVRDEFGVPHIKGKTDADVAYGLAYAHSEDDFGQIQEVVAMTRSRYGALAGKDGAGVDYAQYLLGARDTAERDYKSIPADVRAVVEAYAAGLNHYADKHPDEVRLSKLFPVNGQDVVTGFVLRAPFFYGLDHVIGSLVDGKIPTGSNVAPEAVPAAREPEQNGSNAFAIAPKRMADGKTWLISNSHQPYEGSVAWYEAVVHSDEGLDFAGALFPGSPFVLLGHNRNLGWTNTVNRPDLIDIYKLVLSQDGTKYRYDGQWLPLEQKRVWLAVKFGPFDIPVPQTVYRSVQGPVIMNKDSAFAIRYAGIGNVKAVEQYYRNTKARNWDEWTRSMAIGGIPATNFIYADKTGRIAYIYNALFPDRKPGFDYAKILPGDVSADVWKGPVGFDRYPRIVDPASGFVFNSNNSPYLAAGAGSEMKPGDYSPLLGIETGTTNRGFRADELLSADSSITPEELLAIKFDKAYARKGWIADWMNAMQALDPKGDKTVADAQKLLATWDWTSDGVGPADALAERVIRLGMMPHWWSEKMPDPRAMLQQACGEFMKRYGRLDPPLSEIQRLRRGSVDLPMLGGTDTLRAATSWDLDQKDGKMRVKHGDSFIMLVRWDKAGRVESESIQPYGAATNRPDSPHYTDQMKLFVDQKFKPVHFEWADALAHAKRHYRP